MISETELPVFTLGWELEATHRVGRRIPDVQVGHDGSVGGEGLEYRVRREAVHNPERSLAALRMLVGSPGLQVDDSCGFHVHVGLGVKTRKIHSWAANYVTLARLVEAEAFLAVQENRRSNSYCRSWKTSPGAILSKAYHPSKFNNDSRYCWVNPVEIFRPGGIRTIEIRLMGGSKRYLQLLSWISFCRNMAASSWALVHDPSRLEEEVAENKEVLKIIRGSFIKPTLEPKDRAKACLILAARTGFYDPVGHKPLRLVGSVERGIQMERERTEREKEEYQKDIQGIRQYLEMEKQSLLYLEDPVKEGDIVEAMKTDNDHYCVPGTHYTVYSDDSPIGPAHIVIKRRDNGTPWNVAKSIMKLVERRRVSISVA